MMIPLFANAPRIADIPRLARLSRRYAARLTISRPVATARRTFSFTLSRGTDGSVPYRRYAMPNSKAETVERSAPDGSRSKHVAYIALGSNLGDRIAMIEKACREMDSRGIQVRRTSSLWETEPMYVLDQENFVNGACEVETELEPFELLDQLQDIERSMGRKKLIDKGPRNIDLDILLYDNATVSHERLCIPHIGIPEREFVLRPLAE